MWSWDQPRLIDVVRRAVARIEVTACDAALCDEMALFDAESEQWHYVPASEFLK